MSELRKQLEKLSVEKRELVLNKLRKQKLILDTENNNKLSTPTIERISRKQPLLLSFAQQRLWFLDQLEAKSSTYNIPLAVKIVGLLDVEVLEQVIAEIIQRHEVLRTTFPTVDGSPIQAIAPTLDLTLMVIDLQSLPEVDQLSEVQRLATEEAHLPFDLAKGPLLRGILLKLSESEYVLVFTVHHIVFDGWSMGILIRELIILYKSFSTGNPSPLPELTIQYADFAHWQRQCLSGQVLDDQLAYWKQQLSGDISVLQLPTDKARSLVQTFKEASQSIVFSKTLTKAIKNISEQSGATLFMTLLAAFQTLLYRYTGQEAISVGSPIANRNRSEIEGLIGFFANTLVLCVHLSGDFSFLELLKQVQEVALGAYANQDLPFEQIIAELNPDRKLSRTPLFQVMFVFQNTPLETLALPGLVLSPLEVNNKTAKFDLTLSMEEIEEELIGVFKYNSDLFDVSTISRMVGHFQTLLEGIVANPQQKILELPLLTEAELHQLLVEWNNTQTDYPQDKCIHQLFEEQVEKTPDAVAVVFEDQQLTYQELNNRANQLAHYLQTLEVKQGTLVGICIERSLGMVVGVLGILKAGGAYVPLDPKWPTKRLEKILTSIDLRCLITQYSLLNKIQGLQWKLSQLRDVICLDVDTPKPPPEPIYTSIVSSFWDRMAEIAVDRITAGGFISSYTGQPFSEAEVDEYRNHIVKLAEPYLDSSKRVLEIGCGSGLIMFEIAPQVKFYLGIDPSEVTQAKNRDYVINQNLTNIDLQTGFAHEISSFSTQSFDLIILASTIQFFPGYFYLKQVIQQALQLLVPGGAILIADILDIRSKEDFQRSLEKFALQHIDDPSIKTKVQLDNELYLDADFFFDLQQELGQISHLKIVYREGGFKNELHYRYDVILQKADRTNILPEFANHTKLKKRVWTGWNLHHLKENNLSTAVTADETAYIIHTSGSTGIPKGVIVRHQSVVNLIDWVNKTFQIGSGDRLLFTASLCFDLSVYDIFGILGSGASLHIASNANLLEPKELVNLLVSEPITFWDSTPAVLQQLVSFLPSGKSSNSQLRLIFLSGDWIPVTLPDLLKEAFYGVKVIGLGGATEATIWSNYYPIEKVDPQWVSIPYGKPLQNCQYYILDSYFTPCPIGVCGNLYIGGSCLSSGYTNSNQTEEKFISHPFNKDPEARLYHTGDLARYLPNGNIEFLGRTDLQVKIRGFRIELGEIETVLNQRDDIQAACVVVREDIPSNKLLVAYIVLHPQMTTTISQLRQFLKARLADYMVPSAFVILEALPLTPNGKVDRHALPAPESRGGIEVTLVTPSTPTEEILVTIWMDILGLEKVSIYDNFFELGGHSLMALVVISKIRDVFSVELPVVCLFQSPTIAAIAQAIDTIRQSVNYSSTPANIVIDIEAESFLDIKIQPDVISFRHTTNPKSILLTGATGFLGVHLLSELLDQTTANIYCLVRSANVDKGKERIQENMTAYFLWDEEFRNRIIPIIGDLSQPLLGVSPQQFHILSSNIDVIYHNGAWVNFLHPYSNLKATNVTGTQEILRLASNIKIKAVHLVSTRSVVSSSTYQGKIVRESEGLDYSQNPEGGYAQSKWVAEKLVMKANKRGIPVSIYRPGTITGHSKIGICNTNDLLWRMIKSCIDIGVAPNLDMMIDMTPVDYVSRAIVHISQQEESLGKTFHLLNPNSIPWKELINYILSLGFSITPISYNEWYNQLAYHAQRSSDQNLHFCVNLLSGDNLSQDNQLSFDCQNTLLALTDTDIICPQANIELFNKYFSYLISSGFLDKPQNKCYSLPSVELDIN